MLAQLPELEPQRGFKEKKESQLSFPRAFLLCFSLLGVAGLFTSKNLLESLMFDDVGKCVLARVCLF